MDVEWCWASSQDIEPLYLMAKVKGNFGLLFFPVDGRLRVVMCSLFSNPEQAFEDGFVPNDADIDLGFLEGTLGQARGKFEERYGVPFR